MKRFFRSFIVFSLIFCILGETAVNADTLTDNPFFSVNIYQPEVTQADPAGSLLTSICTQPEATQADPAGSLLTSICTQPEATQTDPAGSLLTSICTQPEAARANDSESLLTSINVQPEVTQATSDASSEELLSGEAPFGDPGFVFDKTPDSILMAFDPADFNMPPFPGFGDEELYSAMSATDFNPASFKGAVPSKIADGAVLNIVPMQSFQIRFVNPFKMKNAIWNSDKGMTAVRNKNGSVKYYKDSVVSITPSGKLTAIGVGTTNIAAASADGMWIRGFTVNVVEFPKSVVYLNKGKTKQLRFYNTKPSKMVFATSNSLITGMVNKGKLTGNSVGTASVVGLYDPYNTGVGFNYGVYVFVEDPVLMFTTGLYPANASLTSGNLYLSPGQTFQIYIGNVYHHGVYKSNKPGVACVNESGLITALSRGKARITDTINGRKFTVNVTVY